MENKDVENKRCCIRTEDDRGTSLPQGPKVKKEEMFCTDDEKDSFSWYITPTGSKAEERSCALTIDGSRGSKGGGWDGRDDSEDSDEVYSDRGDSDDSNSDKGGYLYCRRWFTMFLVGWTRMTSFALFLCPVPCPVILLRLMSSYSMRSMSRNPITFDEFHFIPIPCPVILLRLMSSISMRSMSRNPITF